jgi:hypothetical protein
MAAAIGTTRVGLKKTIAVQILNEQEMLQSFKSNYFKN